MYKIFEARQLKFHIKFDLVDDSYIPHCKKRHDLEIEDVIASYFNKTEEIFNEVNLRFEAYSEKDEIYVYYNFKHNNKNEILIITAFRKD